MNFSPNSFPKCTILHFSCPVPFITLEWTTWFWIIFSCEELSSAQFKNPHPTSHLLSSRSLEGWEWRGCVRPHSSLKHPAGEAVLWYGLGPPSHQCLTALVLNTRRENSGIRGNFSYSLAILEEVLLQLRLTSHADISGLCVSSSPSQLPDMGPPLPNATAWKLKTCTMTSVTSKLCNLPYPQVNSWLRHFLLQDASKQYKGTKVQSNNSMFGTDVQKSKINTSICLPVKFFTELFTYLNVVCLFTSITDLHPRF